MMYHQILVGTNMVFQKKKYKKPEEDGSRQFESEFENRSTFLSAPQAKKSTIPSLEHDFVFKKCLK